MNYNKKIINQTLNKKSSLVTNRTFQDFDLTMALVDFNKDVMQFELNNNAYLTANYLNENIIKLDNKQNKKLFYRGNVVDVQLGETIGKEYGLKHKAIILKNYYYNVVLIPLTSQNYNSGYPGYVDIPLGEVKSLSKNSVALVEQIRTVSKDRIIYTHSGLVPKDVLKRINKVIVEHMALEFHEGFENLKLGVKAKDEIIKNKDEEIKELKEKVKELDKDTLEYLEKIEELESQVQ
jgi:mRNA interferase MazF